MDRYLWRIIIGMVLLGLMFLAFGVITKAQAKQPSILCKTRDTKEYIDIVSTGGSGALVQINGGEFLEGVAEFKDPMLYVTVPLDTGVFLVVFDVKERQGMSALNTTTARQVHEMDCKFRE